VPLLAAALLVPAAWCPPARAAEPAASAKPFPAIEAGMHTSTIKRIAVDRAGRWAVTASDDKTARIWNLASGKQEGVLRVPLGEGYEGRLYAVALSPDGALVALGGFTQPNGPDQAIYLFDRASGRLLQRLAGLPNVVFYLAFAADGRRLAAALGGANGVRVYGATGQGVWAQVAADGDYGAASHSVEFDAAGRLLATSWDGELRLYGAGGSGRLQPLVRRAAPGGKLPFFARFSPDGRRIAVGFDDSPAVAVLDGTSLEPLAAADTSSITNGNFYGLAWSADGRRLLAAGRYDQGDGSSPLVVWPAGGGAPQRLPLGMTNTVMDLRPLADGRLVYAGGGPAWGVLDPQLRPTKVFAGPPVLDHRSELGSQTTAGFQAFRQAPDGRWLEFRALIRSAQGPTARLVRFDLAQRRLLLPGAAAPGGLAPRSTGLPIEGLAEHHQPHPGRQALAAESIRNVPQPGDQRRRQCLRAWQ
jgi:Tol biopolymer transport system component